MGQSIHHTHYIILVNGDPMFVHLTHHKIFKDVMSSFAHKHIGVERHSTHIHHVDIRSTFQQHSHRFHFAIISGLVQWCLVMEWLDESTQSIPCPSSTHSPIPFPSLSSKFNIIIIITLQHPHIPSDQTIQPPHPPRRHQHTIIHIM